MKKALIVTTVSGFVPQFEMNNVRLLQRLGYEVHYASNFRTPVYGKDNRRLDGSGVVRHQVDFVRSPFRVWENVRAYGQLKRLAEDENFSLVHCHTPLGGVLGRLAFRNTSAKIIYTAHGFHFYQGAPILNWLIYYPVEKYLAKFTDVIITINQEDYKRAKGFQILKKGKVKHINGVGIDLQKIESVPASSRNEFGIPDNALLLISVGELNRNKNQKMVIQALNLMKSSEVISHPIWYLVCGKGKYQKKLEHMVEKYRIKDKVIFAGYRADVIGLMKMSDLYVMTSYREGLPVSMLEAMACGLPVIATDIRGIRELIVQGQGGYLIQPGDEKGLAIQLERTINKLEKEPFGNFNKVRCKEFDSKKVEQQMEKIYRKVIEKDG